MEFAVGDLLNGSLLVESVVEGGMGQVLAVRDIRHEEWTEPMFALKTFSHVLSWKGDVLERFRREAAVWIQLKHPHVVSAMNLQRYGTGGQLLMLEWMPGGDLRAKLSKGRPSLEESVAIICQLCAGVEYLHGEGLVHRDIKPSNILFGRNGRVKIGDLGLVRPTLEDDIVSVNGELRGVIDFSTHHSGIIGTLPYMAPEQLKPPHQASSKSDQFAVGVVAYELLAGVRPFLGRSYEQLRGSILAGEFAPLPERCGAFEEVIRRALALNPAERFDSVAAFRGVFSEVAAASGVAQEHLQVSGGGQEEERSANDWLNVGYSLNRLGDNEGALEACMRALEIAPEEALINHNCAVALGRCGRREEGIALFEKAYGLVEGNDDERMHVMLYVSHSTALKRMGRIEEAFALLDRALAEYPSNENIVEQLLGLARSADRDELAEEALQRLIDIYTTKPGLDDGRSMSWEGVSLAQVGLMREGKSMFELATRRHPSYGPAWYNLGVVAHMSGDLLMAHGCYARALHECTEVEREAHDRALANLIVCKRALGDGWEAQHVWGKRIQSLESPDPVVELVKLSSRAGLDMSPHFTLRFCM